MRFVRLELSSPDMALELSPEVAVLDGMTPTERAAVVGALRSVFAGESAAVSAWIIVEDTLVPLTAGLIRPLSKLLRGLDPILDKAKLGLDVGDGSLDMMTELSSSIDAPLARMIAVRALLEIMGEVETTELTAAALMSTLEAVRTRKSMVPITLRLKMNEAEQQRRAAEEALTMIDDWQRELDRAHGETTAAEERATRTFSNHRSFLRFIEARSKERDSLAAEGFTSYDAFRTYVRSAIPAFELQGREAAEAQRVATEGLRALEAGRYANLEYQQIVAEEYALDLRLHLAERPRQEWAGHNDMAVRALRTLAQPGASDRVREIVFDARQWLADKESGAATAPHLDMLYSGPEEMMLSRAEGELTAQLNRHRNLPAVGSIPLILDDAFEGLPASNVERLIRLLEGAVSEMQIIYVGSNPTMKAWAAGIR